MEKRNRSFWLLVSSSMSANSGLPCMVCHVGQIELFQRLTGGHAGTGLAHDLVHHAVSIIHQIVQHANLPCFGRAVVVGVAIVQQIGVGSRIGAVQPALGQAELFHHGQRALCDHREAAFTVSHAADQLHLPAGITGLFPCPRQGVVFFLADVSDGFLARQLQEPLQVAVDVVKLKISCKTKDQRNCYTGLFGGRGWITRAALLKTAHRAVFCAVFSDVAAAVQIHPQL